MPADNVFFLCFFPLPWLRVHLGYWACCNGGLFTTVVAYSVQLVDLHVSLIILELIRVCKCNALTGAFMWMAAQNMSISVLHNIEYRTRHSRRLPRFPLPPSQAHRQFYLCGRKLLFELIWPCQFISVLISITFNAAHCFILLHHSTKILEKLQTGLTFKDYIHNKAFRRYLNNWLYSTMQFISTTDITNKKIR